MIESFCHKVHERGVLHCTYTKVVSVNTYEYVTIIEGKAGQGEALHAIPHTSVIMQFAHGTGIIHTVYVQVINVYVLTILRLLSRT